MTSDLDLNIPEGQTLTIVGNGNHIYELGGRLLNSGEGEVVFAAKTYLYPSASDSVDGTFVAIGSSDGIVLNESAPYYSNGDNAASAEAETWNA